MLLKLSSVSHFSARFGDGSATFINCWATAAPARFAGGNLSRRAGRNCWATLGCSFPLPQSASPGPVAAGGPSPRRTGKAVPVVGPRPHVPMTRSVVAGLAAPGQGAAALRAGEAGTLRCTKQRSRPSVYPSSPGARRSAPGWDEGAAGRLGYLQRRAASNFAATFARCCHSFCQNLPLSGAIKRSWARARGGVYAGDKNDDRKKNGKRDQEGERESRRGAT